MRLPWLRTLRWGQSSEISSIINALHIYTHFTFATVPTLSSFYI